MIEKHPFKPFVPKVAKYLLLGSFPGKDHGDWYYGTKRSQFWKIIEKVYRQDIKNKKLRQKLFRNLNLAVTDIILYCERSHENNLDNNLINITYNKKVINTIIKSKNIVKIYFSSRFVEMKFKKFFEFTQLGTLMFTTVVLPSPSPRYAKLSLNEKTRIYKSLLPKLKTP